jgi:hypothetical protein
MKFVLISLLLLNCCGVAFAEGQADESPNPPPSGACHLPHQTPFGPSCVDGVSKDNCDDQGGSWEPGGQCN